ncbi:hypothetical protein SO802_032936 [Lithocarpus litseifolius]|uniref:Proteasomal ATPase second OB domain-containing protein n=1 Tax=Lithocarpus litseifolius TaxID=425828 RepID=A0AAW2BDN3_9ROSI
MDPTRRRRNSSWRRHQLEWVANITNRKAQIWLFDSQALTPHTKCRLQLLKLERVKDYLLMEEEFVSNQGRLKPEEENVEEDRSKIDDLRGSPMSIGNLEELIDENHAIVSLLVGLKYYVGILSFVDKDQLEPSCTMLMHNKLLSVVGLLQDEVVPFFHELGPLGAETWLQFLTSKMSLLHSFLAQNSWGGDVPSPTGIYDSVNTEYTQPEFIFLSELFHYLH